MLDDTSMSQLQSDDDYQEDEQQKLPFQNQNQSIKYPSNQFQQWNNPSHPFNERQEKHGIKSKIKTIKSLGFSELLQVQSYLITFLNKISTPCVYFNGEIWLMNDIEENQLDQERKKFLKQNLREQSFIILSSYQSMQNTFLYKFYESFQKVQPIDKNLNALELLEFASQLRNFIYDVLEFRTDKLAPLFFLPFLFVRIGNQLKFFGDILMKPQLSSNFQRLIRKDKEMRSYALSLFIQGSQEQILVNKVATLLYYWARRSRKLKSPTLKEFLRYCAQNKQSMNLKKFFYKLQKIKMEQSQKIFVKEVTKQQTLVYSFPSLRILSLDNLIPRLLGLPLQLNKRSFYENQIVKDQKKTVQFYCNDYLKLNDVQQFIFVAIVGILTISININQYQSVCYALYSQIKLFQNSKQYDFSQQAKIILGVLNQVKKIVQKGGQRQRAIRTLQKILSSYKQFAKSVVLLFSTILNNKYKHITKELTRFYLIDLFEFQLVKIQLQGMQDPRNKIQYSSILPKRVYIVECQKRYGIGYNNGFQPNRCLKFSDNIYFEEDLIEGETTFRCALFTKTILSFNKNDDIVSLSKINAELKKQEESKNGIGDDSKQLTMKKSQLNNATKGAGEKEIKILPSKQQLNEQKKKHLLPKTCLSMKNPKRYMY